MEFLIDSPNIQVKSYETFNISELDQILIYKYSSTSLDQLNKKLYYILDFSINLNDYYLINSSLCFLGSFRIIESIPYRFLIFSLA